MDNDHPKDLGRLRIDRSAPVEGKGKAANARLIACAFFLAILAASLYVFGGSSPAGRDQAAAVRSDQRESAGNAASPAAQARFGEPRPGDAGAVLNATGFVVAQRQAAVSSKATGRLAQLLVDEGDRVKKGDLIGVLENDDLRAVVARNEAAILDGEAKLRSAEAEKKEAFISHQRITKLFETKVVSSNEKTQADAKLERAEAQVASAQAALALARAELDKSRIELSYTEIRAPFDGTVISKNAEIGEIVAPLGSAASARAAIVTIADMSSLEFEADVSEANLSKVFIGQSCSITLDSFPEKKYPARVSKIVPAVDRAKATVLTKVRFLELDSRVLPDMSAKAEFRLEDRPQP